MNKPVKFNQLILIVGDIAILYLSLLLTLFIRYGTVDENIKKVHFWPFTIIFVFWLLIFYIIGFYELKELKNSLEFAKKTGLALIINFLVAISFFYFIPSVGITPKTNLFIFSILFGSAYYTWRTAFNNFLNIQAAAKKILLIGYNQVAEELAAYIGNQPQFGYEIKFWMKEGLNDKEFNHLSQIILANDINMIVVPAHIKKSPKAARIIYKNLALGIEVVDLASLYEMLFKKVPIAELEEVWFLENLAKNKKTYDLIKQPLERTMAFILSLIFLPIGLLAIILIKLNSSGSAFFTQIRVGKNGRRFVLWKFRTMFVNAEEKGPQWSKPNDKRITSVGKILRRTHLDELPQLINILKGDLSLMGPRPERPEFIKELEKEIPYYELRHLIKPGLTGWAQINYRYGASLDDAYEKLQYEIYYLKNRSFWLDTVILIKTIRRFFTPA